MNKKFRKLILFVATGILVGSLSMIGCNNSNEEKVVIYTNADDEAVEAMKKAIDSNGYENKYLMQSFGTSELGGKLLAEGKDKNDISMKMAECIIKEGRKEIIKSYSIALYQGESTPTEDISGNIKYYKEKLTVDLLKEHQKLSEECK